MTPTPTEEPAERTSVTLPRSLARRLAREAEVTGRSASSLVREALHDYFARHPAEEVPPFVAVGKSGRSDTSRRAEELVGKAIDRKHPRKGRRR